MLENKCIEIEIKEIQENGTFLGVASPFNNVDLGNDRVMPTVANRNSNKTVPYLWQHDPHNPIGEVKLMPDNSGINFEGKLFLETSDQGIPLIPDAHKAYVLMQRKILKNSIGYMTLEKTYVTENGTTIRNLDDIDIMEVSAVTFPMNPDAVIESVKSDVSNNKKESENKLENKGYTQKINAKKARTKYWDMIDALGESFYSLVNDTNLTADQKKTQLKADADAFANDFYENMSTAFDDETAETKSLFLQEIEQKNVKVDEQPENVDNSQQEQQEKELEEKTLQEAMENTLRIMKGEK